MISESLVAQDFPAKAIKHIKELVRGIERQHDIDDKHG